MLVIAHRGFSARNPENSALAFQRAIAAGADLIETDLRLTRDGEIVCAHDASLDRIAGRREAVADSTLLELKSIALPQAQALLTLAEVLAIARGKVRVMLDVKVDSDTMRTGILNTVRSAGMEKDAVYGVRSIEHQVALRALGNRIPVVAMPPRPELLPGFLGGGVHAARLWEEDVTAASVEQVRSAGLQAWVTAGLRPAREAPGYITAARLEALLELGVDAVLVNDVDLAVRTRGARQKSN